MDSSRAGAGAGQLLTQGGRGALCMPPSHRVGRPASQRPSRGGKRGSGCGRRGAAIARGDWLGRVLALLMTHMFIHFRHLQPPPPSRLHRRGLASAGFEGNKTNGSLCDFPYCDCWTDFPSECLSVSAPITVNNTETDFLTNATTIVGSTYNFTIESVCDEPLGHRCDQTLYKLEFNSCESEAARNTRAPDWQRA
jgi:hypothetical protein